MKSKKSILRGTIVLTIIILVLVALPAPAALADSDGPRNAGAGANQATVGTEPWTNPGNITSPGSPYASVTLRRLVISNYLKGTQYGFNIPLDAAIAGIEVIVNRYANPPTTSVSDYEVRVLKAGAPVGDNKANATPWPNTLTAVTYGGPTDLWGTTWTPAEINAVDFGAAVSAHRDNNGNSNRNAVVDTIQVTVYYGYTSTTAVTCGSGTPITYGDSLSCLATVTSINGTTPTGTVAWTTDGSGTFNPNPCTLSGSGNVATCSATYTPSSVGDGSHLVTATYSGDAYYTPSTGSQTVTVNTRPVTVTAYPQTKVFGDPDPALTYQITSGSLVFSDTFTGSLTRDPGENVGPYAILQGTLALPASYVLTFVGDDLTITPRAVEVTADAQTKEYGDPDPELTYQITSGLLIPGDVFTGSLTREFGEDVGTYAILQGTLALSDNYDLSYVGANLTITGFRVLLPVISRLP